MHALGILRTNLHPFVIVMERWLYLASAVALAFLCTKFIDSLKNLLISLRVSAFNLIT
jgi:hypothetical protein